jgi:hypothetical protein
LCHLTHFLLKVFFFIFFFVIGIRSFWMIVHADICWHPPISDHSQYSQATLILVFLLSAMFLTFAIVYFEKLSFFHSFFLSIFAATYAASRFSESRTEHWARRYLLFHTEQQFHLLFYYMKLVNWLIAKCPNLFPITRRLFKNRAADHCQL